MWELLFICFTIPLFLKDVTAKKTADEFHLLFKRDLRCPDCTAPRIKSSPKNITISLKSPKTSLRCRATGNPPPEIQWMRNDKLIRSKQRSYQIKSETIKRNDVYKGVKSVLDIDNLSGEGFGRYICVATNKIGTVSSPPAFVSVNYFNVAKNIPGSSTYLHKENDENCQLVANLSLALCGQFLDPAMALYGEDNVMLDKTLKTITRDLDSPNTIFSPKCRPYIVPFLCYYNLPYCSKKEGGKGETITKKYTICRSNCAQLSRTYCNREFQQYRGKNVLHPIVPASCDALPERDCFQMGEEIHRVKKIRGLDDQGTLDDKHYGNYVDPNNNCIFDDGQNYRGIQNRTRSNRLCLPWSAVGTTNLKLRGHNYCRNLEPVRKQPWCYVGRTERGVEYEYCQIPTCASPIRSPTSNILYTIIPCLLFALLLSLAIIAWAWRRHKQYYYQQTPECTQLVPRVNPKIEELNREDLCDYRLLGDGNIGRVYTADYTGSKDGRTFTTCVAVKAIIEKATSKQIEDFVREAETRAHFKHENIVCLVGVMSKEEPLSLIYEYTEFGDLHEYLLRHSPNFSDAHASGDCDPLEYNDLVVIATQIANGMSYLSSHSFVHKDLAVRNCLVDNGVIKISDFSGLSDQYAGDYFRLPGRLPLPVRWMSPESLSDMTYSTASDMYSFGVVLWEIFSYGSRPYFGLNNQQAMECVLDYQLLPCPEGCSMNIFNLMVECWAIEVNNRPSFGEVYSKLKSFNDVTRYPTAAQGMPLHPQASMHSLPSTHTSHSYHMPPPHEMKQNGRHSSLNKSHEHSIHTKSSTHSLNSHYHNNSIPPSLISMTSPSIMNEYRRPLLQGDRHHSLPRDGRHSVSHDAKAPCEQRLSPHGSHSLPRDSHYAVHEGHFAYPPIPHGEMRSASANSHHHSMSSPDGYGGYPHERSPSANGYIQGGADSYISSLQSYPSSITGPPVSMFSRPNEQYNEPETNHSVKSYDSIHKSPLSVDSQHVYI